MVFGETPEPLFEEGPQLQSTVLLRSEVSAKRSRSAKLNTRLFIGTEAKEDWIMARVRLNLFADVQLTGIISRQVPPGDGRWVGHGQIEGEPHSQFTVAVDHDALSASIHSPVRGNFRILYAGDDSCTIAEIDPSASGVCGVDGLSVERGAESRTRPLLRTKSQPLISIPANSLGTTNLVTILDLMVVYTAEARAGAGNVSAMNTLIDLAVAEANTVYQNSEANVRLRLVYRGEVNYTESPSLSTNLNRLQTKDDGFMDNVHSLRETNRADLVCLITEHADEGVSGLAFTMTEPSTAFRSLAFSVVKRADTVGTFIFVHELSHNLGCQHDRENALDAAGNLKPGAFPYSFGHRFVVGRTTYHDVMAYAPGQVVPYLSNPNVLFMGVPTGLPGITNGANNVLTISNTAPLAGAFYGPLVRTAPPLVSLTTPVADAVFTAETNLVLIARVSDVDGPVQSVEFYHGDELIGSTSSIIPGLTIGSVTNLFGAGLTNFYSVVWTNVPPGEHRLTARAIDLLGASSTTTAIQIVARPRNDNYANRIVVSGVSPAVSGSNRAATMEANEPMHTGNPGGKSVWYSWIAPRSGTVSLTANGASILPLPAVYKSISATASAPVARDLSFDNTNFVARTTFDAISQQQYAIVIDSPSGTSGEFTFTLAFEPSPQNDDFANRTLIPGDAVTFVGSNSAATLEAGEPVHAAPNVGGKSVWFTWVAPKSGTVIVSATTTNFFPLLDVYRGKSLLGLTNAIGRKINFDSTNLLTTLSCDVVSGENYQLALDGLSGGAGVFTLKLAYAAPPPNDNFSDRISLSGTLVSLQTTNLYATREETEPLHVGQPGGRSIWYSWRAPVSGAVTVTARGENFFLLLDVYSGSAVNALTNVAGRGVSFNQTNFTTTLTFNAVAYRTYALAVDGFSGFSGAIALTLKTANSPPTFQSLSSLSPSASNFRMSLFGSAGQKFVVQATTNLTEWTDIFSGAFVTNSFGFTDEDSRRFDSRFYRVLALP